MTDVVMPRLSDSMEEGTVLRWLKGAGEEVHRGDELVEIETDKATMVYESDSDGTLEIVAEEGTTLPIGELIARLGGDSEGGATPARAPARPDQAGQATNGEATAAAEAPGPPAGGDAAAERAESAEPAAPAETAEPPGPAAPADGAAATSAEESREPRAPAQRGEGERVKASPLARRIARERGVDLGSIAGSGPGGRVVRADVEAAGTTGAPATRRPAAPSPGGGERPGTSKGETTTLEPTRTQQTIARRMAESKATIPHFVLRSTVDMEDCVSMRRQLRELEPDDLPTYNDMIVRACALALREFPRANGSWRDGRFELHSRVNVGIAVAVEDALVVPTIFDADAKSLTRIARDGAALAAAVRDGSVTPPQLSGGTFTVSNLGMFGVTGFDAVINPPQAAILAVGAIEQRPVVRDGAVVARHVVELSLACDHRILYGADAARFLARVRRLLEHPIGLVA